MEQIDKSQGDVEKKPKVDRQHSIAVFKTMSFCLFLPLGNAFGILYLSLFDWLRSCNGQSVHTAVPAAMPMHTNEGTEHK